MSDYLPTVPIANNPATIPLAVLCLVMVLQVILMARWAWVVQRQNSKVLTDVGRILRACATLPTQAQWALPSALESPDSSEQIPATARNPREAELRREQPTHENGP